MVTECICYRVDFERLKKIIDSNNLTSIEELKEIEEFGEGCMMCVPYVEEIFKTGKTEFSPF